MTSQPITAGSENKESILMRVPLIAALALLVWIALALYVIAPHLLPSKSGIVLLPALLAALLSYAGACKALRASPAGRFGATLVFFWVALALLAPLLPLTDPNKPIAPFAPPGTEAAGHYFLLGADLKGRDMLARVTWGGQRVLVWATGATVLAFAAGIAAGLAAGYWRGWVDTIISFIANIALSFPVMVLFIVILNILGTGAANVLIAVTLASAPGIMRIVRGLTLDLRTHEYVLAAQMRGERAPHILFVEILPNMRAPLLVDACLRLGYTIVAITALTFLGLGLQPPDPDWGLMIAEAARVAVLWQFAYMIVIPAVAVSSLVLGLNLMADGFDATRGTQRGDAP